VYNIRHSSYRIGIVYDSDEDDDSIGFDKVNKILLLPRVAYLVLPQQSAGGKTKKSIK
jgi:hypothetical protein